MYIRCFIAIGMSDSLIYNMSKFIDLLKEYDADVKWVTPENIHLTLKFLGNTPEFILSKIQESLLNIVSSYQPFYIKIYGIGVFPNKKYPRVIWIGVESLEILKKLRNDIEYSMRMLGFQKEDKEFNPHLTIGRVRSQKGITYIINAIDNFKEKEFGNIYVDAIKLMKSDLKPKGSEYSCIYKLPFGKEV